MKIEELNRRLCRIYLVVATMSVTMTFLRAAESELHPARAVCLQSLDAMSAGDAEAAHKADDVDAYHDSSDDVKAIEVVRATVQKIIQLGSGLPVRKTTVYDNEYSKKSSWILIQKWDFPNGIEGYAGCARFSSLDGSRRNVFYMMDSVEGLKAGLMKQIEADSER